MNYSSVIIKCKFSLKHSLDSKSDKNHKRCFENDVFVNTASLSRTTCHYITLQNTSVISIEDLTAANNCPNVGQRPSSIIIEKNSVGIYHQACFQKVAGCRFQYLTSRFPDDTLFKVIESAWYETILKLSSIHFFINRLPQHAISSLCCGHFHKHSNHIQTFTHKACRHSDSEKMDLWLHIICLSYTENEPATRLRGDLCHQKEAN